VLYALLTPERRVADDVSFRYSQYTNSIRPPDPLPRARQPGTRGLTTWKSNLTVPELEEYL
jgi:hypothetical protein